MPTLRGNDQEQRQHEFLYWEFTERGKSQAARIGHWKGVRVNLKKNPDAPIQLYDLAKDIAESNDIAAEHRRLVALGVHFVQPPTDLGTVKTAVFDDTCGNLIQIAEETPQ